jgi:hypothetical protein
VGSYEPDSESFSYVKVEEFVDHPGKYHFLKPILPKRDEVAGEWRKLHNEELRDLCSSPSIIRIIKSRRMRWEGHVA